MTDLVALQQRLGYRFRSAELLRLAMTHPSVVNDVGSILQTNQRLEFLGDAVLQLLLTRELFDRYPRHGEGPLTKFRAKLVNRRMLASLARDLGLDQQLILSPGEEATGGRQRPAAQGDAFEALIGALFVDGGLEAARRFVLWQFAPFLQSLEALPVIDNPKGELQELLQADSAEAPTYQTLNASGPEHDRVFECAVSHRGVELGRGTGKSKKEAESAAALAAFQILKAAAESAPRPPE